MSRLRNHLSDAAKAGIINVAAAREIDQLRRHIESWRRVGLGRMTTQVCFEQAAAASDRTQGRELFELAEAWRLGLTSFPLVGIEAAAAAAGRWGTPDEIERIRIAAEKERTRIGALSR